MHVYPQYVLCHVVTWFCMHSGVLLLLHYKMVIFFSTKWFSLQNGLDMFVHAKMHLSDCFVLLCLFELQYTRQEPFLEHSWIQRSGLGPHCQQSWGNEARPTAQPQAVRVKTEPGTADGFSAQEWRGQQGSTAILNAWVW